jgi:hypothetical protein
MSDSPGRAATVWASFMEASGFTIPSRPNHIEHFVSPIAPHVNEWSDAEVYFHLGNPKREDVMTRDGKPLGLHAPAMLVAPMQNHKQSHASLVQETTIISDFGQSYKPGTMLNYQAPETRFEGRTGFEADTWDTRRRDL